MTNGYCYKKSSRIASTRRFQQSDLTDVEKRVLLLKILRVASTRRVQPSDSILRRETRNHAIALETRAT